MERWAQCTVQEQIHRCNHHFVRKFIPIKNHIWNFFATSHGKGAVDGIGAVVKNKVRRMILTREAIVNNAKEFVAAFKKEKSLIEVTEVTNDEISEIQNELELKFVFDTAEVVPQISNFHQLQVVNGKLIGFLTSEKGYKYLETQ